MKLDARCPIKSTHFCDLWTLDEERERVIRNTPILLRESGIDDETARFWQHWMNALRQTQPKMLAYLSYMVERLLWMKSVLRPTGSIYLHCDPTASHYIKAMMDSIFGHQNFLNELIWHYDGPQRPSRKNFGRKHDTILRYSKSQNYFANPDGISPMHLLTQKELSSLSKHPDGRYYYSTPRGDYTDNSIKRLEGEGRIHWTKNGKARVLHFMITDGDGQHYRKKQLHDVWNDIVSIGHAGGKESLHYPTQKPLALLNRIIQASSRPGEVVFDPFCGCATTLEAAHRLNRRWIGIDVAFHAIKRVSKNRLGDRCDLVEERDFEITGVPLTLEGARDLWEHDKYHFQKWAVEEIDGFVTTKRTADGGIDGRLYFDHPDHRDIQSMIIEVKGGRNVSIRDLRSLHGVLENNHALLAGLIILEPLGVVKTRNFHRFMAEAGDLDVQGHKYARLQMLTVAEILEGKRFETPFALGKGSPQMQLGLKDPNVTR